MWEDSQVNTFIYFILTILKVVPDTNIGYKIVKNIIYLILTAFIVVMCSCSSKSSRVDYLPCQVDEYDDWSFVNAQGEIFCREWFSECPTEVRDGIFFVEENDAYSMYQFDTSAWKALQKIGSEKNSIMICYCVGVPILGNPVAVLK